MPRALKLLKTASLQSHRALVMKRKFADFASRTSLAPMATTKEITLTARESQLRNLLVDVAQNIDKTGRLSEPIVLRWAGGWVRDKLLGIDSHDIDIAINAMTGLGFAEELRGFCDISENTEKHHIGPDDIGNLHKIAANPEKSKNLETTTVKVLGLDLDFVNLRTEVYDGDSRNPVVQFGTAQEDAVRRDATVNALFYNLHTETVEDFTGGLADLENKRICTPMEPLQTFTDDPLRVLRLVRFASRLQFTIDPAVSKVMADPQVLSSLRIKISRERVGVELEKMLRGKHPRSALELIDDLGLYTAIYTDPLRDDLPSPALKRWGVAYKLLHQLVANSAPTSIYDVLVRTTDETYFAWTLASLAPWAHAVEPRDPGNSKPVIPVATTVAREGVRAPNKLCDVITAAHRFREDILRLKNAICTGEAISRERHTIGMKIRTWDARDVHWRVQVLYTILVEAMDSDDISMADNGHHNLLRDWQTFLDHLADMGLMEVTSLKRLVDGKLLARELGMKPGRWMGQALDVCLEWQLQNPTATDPAGAIDEVRNRSGELGITGIQQ